MRKLRLREFKEVGKGYTLSGIRIQTKVSLTLRLAPGLSGHVDSIKAERRRDMSIWST